MNLGAEQKKTAILAGLVVVGGYIFYANVLAGPDVETKKPAARPAAVVSAPAVTGTPNIGRAKGPGRRAPREFKPTLISPPAGPPDFATIDPTLKLALL